jgi:hypothetical protein
MPLMPPPNPLLEPNPLEPNPEEPDLWAAASETKQTARAIVEAIVENLANTAQSSIGDVPLIISISPLKV